MSGFERICPRDDTRCRRKLRDEAGEHHASTHRGEEDECGGGAKSERGQRRAWTKAYKAPADTEDGGPAIILRSISFRVGTWKRSAKTGRASFKTRLKPMKVTATAPAITKARLASHVPAGMPPTSRKFRTFAGFDIPETMRPRPKTTPIPN